MAAVDREARRARLSSALLEVLAGEGMDAVSVRSVAARAGVSIGTVQHYFPTKASMLQHAREVAGAALDARVMQATRGLDEPAAVLAAVLEAVVPDSPASVVALRTFLIFEAAALTNTALAVVSRREDAELFDALAELLTAEGVASPELEARLLVALVGGLAGYVLLADDLGRAAEDARAAVAHHLTRLGLGL